MPLLHVKFLTVGYVTSFFFFLTVGQEEKCTKLAFPICTLDIKPQEGGKVDFGWDGVVGVGSREAEEGHLGLCRQLRLAGGTTCVRVWFQPPIGASGLYMSPSAVAHLLWMSAGVTRE